ncbi:MAG: transcriptional regulator of arginine metabolism [Thermacetogenium sp.]|nr:transcriptional regulator of arginine metabolism [Thermacetogenium sp.]
MKLRRQQMILEIIEEKSIATQEELAEELLARGIKTTQATISRDIKELQLVKVPVGPNVYRYARPHNLEPPRSNERLRRLFRENVVKVDFSENLVLIRTLPGAAQGVASALDHAGWKEIIGTVAGDDTILVIVKPRDVVVQVVERLESLLR